MDADDGSSSLERLQIEVTVWKRQATVPCVSRVTVAAPTGWSLERLELGTPTVAPGTLLTRRFAATVAKDAERTQPYSCGAVTNRGGLYDWSTAPRMCRPAVRAAAVSARVLLVIGGEAVTLTRAGRVTAIAIKRSARSGVRFLSRGTWTLHCAG